MDLSDEALIASFRKTQDTSCFKSLVKRYQNRIYSAAYRVLGNKEEAEEVVQETYLKVHQNLAQFEAKASFSAWIFRIAHNICMNTLRSHKRNQTLDALSIDPTSPFQDEDGGNSQVVSQLADPKPNPSESLVLDERRKYLEASLSQLPEAQRMAIILCDMEGFSYEEIADIVGTNLGTVRSRIFYARQKLRELLTPYYTSADISTSR